MLSAWRSLNLVCAPILVAIAGLLARAPTASASDAAAGPIAVGEVVVPPERKCLPAETSRAPRPKIVSTFPTEGQVVRPGLLVVRITFDRPMTCSGFLGELANLASPCPPQHQTFIQTYDHRTVRTVCLARPGQAYGFLVGDVWSEPFLSLDGQQAQPLALRFSTSSEPTVTSVRDALAEDARAPLAHAAAVVRVSSYQPLTPLDTRLKGALTGLSLRCWLGDYNSRQISPAIQPQRPVLGGSIATSYQVFARARAPFGQALCP